MSIQQPVKPSLAALRWAVADTMIYLHRTGMDYGSDKWFCDEDYRLELYALVVKRYRDLTGGCTPIEKAKDVANLYNQLRKRGWKKLKEGQHLNRENGTQRAFIDTDTEVGSVVYAYIGTIPTVPRLVTKIGYTSEEISKYLAGKRLTHAPKLLATTPGDKRLESHYLAMWSHVRVDGREWFESTRELHDWIASEFAHITPEFPQLRTSQ